MPYQSKYHTKPVIKTFSNIRNNNKKNNSLQKENDNSKSPSNTSGTIPVQNLSTSSNTISSNFGFFESIKSGFGLGLGSSVANRVVDGVMGPRTTEIVHKNDQEIENNSKLQSSLSDCKDLLKNFTECIKTGGLTDCNNLQDIYIKQCQK